MYDSLKSWLNVSITLRRRESFDGRGDPISKPDEELKCYPCSEVKRITNKMGEDIVSSSQLYFDESTSISENDLIVFEGRTRPIELIKHFYSTVGNVALLVVYLT